MVWPLPWRLSSKRHEAGQVWALASQAVRNENALEHIAMGLLWVAMGLPVGNPTTIACGVDAFCGVRAGRRIDGSGFPGFGTPSDTKRSERIHSEK